MDTTTTIILFVLDLLIGAAAGAISAFFTIGVYKNKVDNLETTIGKDEHAGLRKTVGDMSSKVVECTTKLQEREPLGKRKSPVSLTDRGTRFLTESGGEKFVDDNFNDFEKAVEALKPTTSYDVQEDAKKVIETLRDDVRLNPLKDFLFKDGSSLDDLFFVMSIHLRDKILTKKNWNVADIDKHEAANHGQN